MSLLTKIAWTSTTLAPAGLRVFLLILLGVLDLSSDEFANILNTASLVAIYITFSVGLGLVIKPANLLGLALAMIPALCFLAWLGERDKVLYLACFAAYQLYRYVEIAYGRPFAALGADVIFVVAHLGALLALGSYDLLWISLAAAPIYSFLLIFSQVRAGLAVDYRISLDAGRYLGVGLANLSTSGLMFAFPLIIYQKVGPELAAEATIVSACALIATAGPRSYVSAKTNAAREGMSEASMLVINKRLAEVSRFSAVAALLPVICYSAFSNDVFLGMYGLLVIFYTYVGQLSSFNIVWLMMRGQAGTLARWNISIALGIGFYYVWMPSGSSILFLVGVAMVGMAYWARDTFLRKNVHERDFR